MDEARQPKDQLRLVTARSKPALSWFPAVLETAAGEIATEDSPQQSATTVQADALKTAEGKGVAATGEVVHSDSPASAILSAVKDADLVVVGARGHGGFPVCAWAGGHPGHQSCALSCPPCPPEGFLKRAAGGTPLLGAGTTHNR